MVQECVTRPLCGWLFVYLLRLTARFVVYCGYQRLLLRPFGEVVSGLFSFKEFSVNTIFSKPYATPAQLLQHLKNRNLTVENDQAALLFLTNINYHRFKVYLRVFWDDSIKAYKPAGSFEKAVQLYRFDDELRDTLFSIIGRIEIKLRSRLDHTLSAHTKDPFWYLDQSNFSSTGFLAKLNTAFTQARDEYSTHFKQNYQNNTNTNYKSLPPFWAIAELTTFGNLLDIFSAFNKTPFQITPKQNILDDLAKEFGAKNLKELNNWLSLIRDVRNKCAHHSRLWNRNLRAPSSILPLLVIAPAHQNRLYSFIAMLHLIAQKFSMNIDVKGTLEDLFTDYQETQSFLASMGFPGNWKTDPFWK